jgi:hypothetical protein
MHYQEWGYNFLTQAFSMVVPLWIHEITNSYAVDEVAQRLLQELAVTSPNASGYSLSQCHIKYKKKIWVGANSASQTKIINDFHSSGVGGHSGTQVTYQRVSKLFIWKGITQHVDSFVQ